MTRNMTNRIDALGTRMALVFSAASSDSFLSKPSTGQPWVEPTRRTALLFLDWPGLSPCTPFCQTDSFPPMVSSHLSLGATLLTVHSLALFSPKSCQWRRPRSRRVCPSQPLGPVGNCGPVQTDQKDVGASPRVFQQCSSCPPRHCTLSGQLLAAAYGDGITTPGLNPPYGLAIWLNDNGVDEFYGRVSQRPMY